MKDDSLKTLTQRVIQFRDARDWKQFHNAKDLALSLVLEATEVLEHFQWKDPEQVDAYLKTNKADIADELSDVLHCVLLMSHDLGIDLPKAFLDKIKKNEAKYPIAKAKGKAIKYTKL